MGNTRAFYERAYETPRWQPGGGPQGHGPFVKAWYAALLEHVLPLLQLEGARVLEVGAGNGYLVPHLQRRGAKYFGMDLAFSAVRDFPQSKEARAHALVADGECLPFRSDSFDVLLCMEVLEHVHHPATLIDESFRVVRPGGHLVFSSPSYLNLFIIPKLLADAGVPAAERYMNRQPVDRTWTSRALRRLVARRGRVLLQRGVRIHPPLSERFGHGPSAWPVLGRVNGWISGLEARWGDSVPLRWLGLHSLVMARRE